MPISPKTLKMLWGRSASRCSICQLELVMDATETDDASIVGEACHIVAEKEGGPRGESQMSLEERNKYANLILLCNVHHKCVDDQIDSFPVAKLKEIKDQHEFWVRSQLGFDAGRQRDDEVWMSYVEDWENRLHLDEWRNWASAILCHGLPALSHDRMEALSEIRPWLLSRVWPERYPGLLAAFKNFMFVAQDFYEVFGRHASKHGDAWRTEKFYRQESDWNAAEERRLMAKFDGHVGLVQDLMLELTRAANLVCDRVRALLLPTYRLKEGVLLIEGGPYSDFSYKTFRAEYSLSELSSGPYPGLLEFKTIRLERQVSFGLESDDV